jgi:hypothetical protein
VLVIVDASGIFNATAKTRDCGGTKDVIICVVVICIVAYEFMPYTYVTVFVAN